MRAAAVLLVLLPALASCLLPEGDACCKNDVDCADGARCYEGRCALRCHDDAQCDEGNVCDADASVCRLADPDRAQLEACP